MPTAYHIGVWVRRSTRSRRTWFRRELEIRWAQEMRFPDVDSVKQTDLIRRRGRGALVYLAPAILSPVDVRHPPALPATTTHGNWATLQDRADFTWSRVCKSCSASKVRMIGRSVDLRTR